MSKLRQVPGATDVDSSLVLGKPEVQLGLIATDPGDQQPSYT
jgi:hypothetical protein